MNTGTNKVRWPLVADHRDAQCFHCTRRLEDRPPELTPNAPGDGEWRKYCLACQLWTWYDVENKREMMP